MKEWKTYKLSEIAEIQTGPFGSQLHNNDYVDNGTPIVTVEHLGNRKFSTQNLPCVSDADKARLSKYILHEGDIVFSRVGSVDRCSYVSSDEDGWMFSGRCLRVRCNNMCNPLFLYYYFCKETIKQYIRSIAVGATMPSINTKLLSDLPITLPSIDVQDKAVQILSRLDDKIELNRQINDNLEQQIQTLYREWFIDNPKTEWATIALSEVATFVSGYSYKGNELVDSSETAMATIKNFERNGGFKLDGYKPVSPSSKLKEEQHAELFDILVAHTDLTQNAEVIGNAEIILSKDSYRDVIFSMDLVKVVAKESFPYQFLLALLLKNPVFKSHCIGYVNGTTVLHMNKRALPDFNTQIPTCEDAARMNEIAKSIFTKMSENLSEIANLTKLRDSLLPKLMSGELKINEIDC